jgi:hypothetical protein
MNYVISNLMGGIGNCLFQIATGYSASIRDNKEFFCNSKIPSNPHNPISTYLDNILRNIKFSDKNIDETHYNEKGFNFTQIPSVKNNLRLTGYFQSEKYFIENRDLILELFGIDKHTEVLLNEKYSHLFNSKTCSIHVRRNDYVKLQEYHTLLDVNYYIDAVNIIGNDCQYIIFSDDIDWCKKNLTFIKNPYFVEGDLDYQNLYLMSFCDNNIIANSSFSWWGAWLNKNDSKIVISPKIWFGEKNKHLITDDLYCHNWVKI